MMTSNPPRPDDLSRDLEMALGRSLSANDPLTPRHTTLRLHPVVLPPPPGETAQPVEPLPEPAVTADDDIALDDDDDETARKRQLLLGALGGGIAIIGLAAFLVFGIGRGTKEAASVPTILADPSAQTKGAAPPAETETAAQPADKSMGNVSTELVPPTTDGLTPARKVTTIRIFVENDREVVQPR
jgi:hypothetical protein